MSISNPSHLLISRNSPRSPAHPQLAHASTSRHVPSPNHLGRWHQSHSADEISSYSSSHPTQTRGSTSREGFEEDLMHPPTSLGDDGEEEEEDVVIDVHPTFLPDSSMPGKVKVVVGRNEFYCHKDVLWFASPFFQGLLQGNWAETNAIPNSTTPSSYAVDLSPTPSVEMPSSPPTDTDPPSPRHVPMPDESPQHEETVNTESLPAGPSSYHDSRSDQHVDANASIKIRKTNLYLDGTDDPSVADILRELRELPETPDGVRAISDVLEDTTPNLSEVLSNTVSHGSLSRLTIQPPLSDAPILGNPLISPSPSIESTSTQIPLPHRPSSGRHSVRTSRTRSTIRHSFSSGAGIGSRNTRLEAVVELHEESPAAFHDFLFWAYPHLECKVTWTNVENLLALSLKLIVPPLQKLCEHFLMTHASGRPVMALCLAEEHCNAELYREASRFVLDQPSWDQIEMSYLSSQTQLKLSFRRSWFLERLLKLASIDVKKEYICRADCPDPLRCQTQLDEKWRQAYAAVTRYGPPQPSVAFRCLRQLETFPTNPSLVMSHPLCQSAAKTWVMSLFDRMFQPKLVYSNPGTEKYWLWINMN
ncbi:hypothetical protein I302_108225 [Kwoniella bestiolae CBS 10118]|uniref:BTB domain-containing protein n=1 Tax=Kwoniella bestiolae CBS 10118 TaxID=1296100 RepID=A0A1B9FWB3_9TREE|nr:hypothetical protein I302_07410 [Kwoniella bestiolae CBS 10118]OCF23059.1 hypothetical protein I302_07410 [Kwoniella bestiolae CBS 10118]